MPSANANEVITENLQHRKGRKGIPRNAFMLDDKHSFRRANTHTLYWHCPTHHLMLDLISMFILTLITLTY